MKEPDGYHIDCKTHASSGFKSLWRLLPVLLFPALLCGCNQKDLVYPASTMIKISVDFDWMYASDADPEGMSLVFFPEGEDGRVWRYELSGRNGGEIEIPAGRYRMIAFNNDTKYIMFSGTSHLRSYNAYTEESVPVEWPKSVTDSYPRLISCKGYRSPDPLYCATVEDVDVELCSVSYRPCRPGDNSSEAEIKECGRHILKCFPAPRTSNYTCILRNVTNIESMLRGYFVLSGLSPSELIAYDILSGSEGEYMFLASCDGTDITGKTIAFGSSSSAASHQFLYLIAVLADGSVVPYCYDVSDQVMNSHDKRNVMIIVDGVELPYVKPDMPDDPDASFDVVIEDWETVIINHVVTLQ